MPFNRGWLIVLIFRCVPFAAKCFRKGSCRRNIGGEIDREAYYFDLGSSVCLAEKVQGSIKLRYRKQDHNPCIQYLTGSLHTRGCPDSLRSRKTALTCG